MESREEKNRETLEQLRDEISDLRGFITGKPVALPSAVNSLSHPSSEDLTRLDSATHNIAQNRNKDSAVWPQIADSKYYRPKHSKQRGQSVHKAQVSNYVSLPAEANKVNKSSSPTQMDNPQSGLKSGQQNGFSRGPQGESSNVPAASKPKLTSYLDKGITE